MHGDVFSDSLMSPLKVYCDQLSETVIDHDYTSIELIDHVIP